VGELCPSPLSGMTASTMSVSSPSNVNISSLNDMFKEDTTIFQQIMTELNGAEQEKE
jgi:hypothetical protein